MLDTTTLINSTDSLKSVTDNLGNVVLFGTIASIIFIVFYISNFIRKRKAEKSIIQMQKDIHELLEIERSKTEKNHLPRENQNSVR